VEMSELGEIIIPLEVHNALISVINFCVEYGHTLEWAVEYVKDCRIQNHGIPLSRVEEGFLRSLLTFYSKPSLTPSQGA